MRSTFKLFIIGLFVSSSLAACNLPSGTPNAAATLQAVYTAQAATVQALQTQARVTLTPVPGVVFPTLPFLTATPSATSQVLPVQPSLTPRPLSTKVTVCDWAAFVDDITIPDGTVVSPGVQFTKTWRLKNIGTCSWTTSYGLVFQKGNSMNGSSSTHLENTVDPGETVDVSILLTAPSSAGSFRGYWLMRNAAGELFGLGNNASDPFYVEIEVGAPMTTVYRFTSNYCSAVWQTEQELLDCPGDTSNPKGFVFKVENPKLENGQSFNGPTLLMSTEKINNGYIQGTFPAFTVRNGDHFRSTINCAYQAEGCDVNFMLSYQIGNNDVVTLWKYHEIYDGEYRAVDTDLSALAGKSVKFIFTIQANGSADADKLIWAGPRIDRLSSFLTPNP